jgi:hypothetical protein
MIYIRCDKLAYVQYTPLSIGSCELKLVAHNGIELLSSYVVRLSQ